MGQSDLNQKTVGAAVGRVYLDIIHLAMILVILAVGFSTIGLLL